MYASYIHICHTFFLSTKKRAQMFLYYFATCTIKSSRNLHIMNQFSPVYSKNISCVMTQIQTWKCRFQSMYDGTIYSIKISMGLCLPPRPTTFDPRPTTHNPLLYFTYRYPIQLQVELDIYMVCGGNTNILQGILILPSRYAQVSDVP